MRTQLHPEGEQPLHQISARQTAGLIKMPLGTKVGLGQAALCYMGTQLPLPKGAQPPNFWPMSIVAKRSPISATAEHLLIVFMSAVYLYKHDIRNV